MIRSVFFVLLGLFTSSLSLGYEFEEMPAINGWIEVKPGGDTSCARGDDFSFFVYPGNSDKVIFDFIGGGACWNADTCKEGGPFTDNAQEIKEMAFEGLLEGVYVKDTTGNPFEGWTHVVIPYCTGDIHWGENEIEYQKPNGETFTIHHKGANNAKSVMQWVEERYQNHSNTLVTGCSAGAYGSIYWTPHIIKRFPQSQVRQFGDSGSGVITSDFFRNSFPNWNATANAPRWIPNLNPDVVDWYTLSMTDLYSLLANEYPNVQFSQFNSAYDDVQTFYYELMGGDAMEWGWQMRQSVEDISQRASNFSYYNGTGSEHCIIPYDFLYSQNAEGIKAVDWLRNYVNGEVVDSVQCEMCDTDGIEDAMLH